MARKIVVALFVLTILFSVSVWIVSQNHPIILKWCIGTARFIGKPMAADIYMNGSLNKSVNVYHVNSSFHGEKANYYVLYPLMNPIDGFKFALIINIPENYCVRPNGSSIEDYDSVFGNLFQSETGAGFDPYYTLKPKPPLYQNGQIMLSLPNGVKLFDYDSIRVVWRK